MEKKEEKTYSREDVLKSCLEYFNGNDLAAETWMSKYAMKNKKGEFCELNPSDMHKRMAKEFERIEKKYDLNKNGKNNEIELSEYGKIRKSLCEEKIYEYFQNFKHIIPQGSVMSVLGNPYVIGSLSNCIVIPELYDSYAGICFADQQLVQLMKRRAGVGLDITNLRPENAEVSNAAGSSTGAVSFMERYSSTTREVAQCIAKGQHVLTKRGLIEIENINNKDEVLTKIGFVRVLDILKSKKETYKITTKKGYSIITSKEHIFVDENNKEKKLEDFNVGDKISLITGKNNIENLVKLKDTKYEFKRKNDESRYEERFENIKNIEFLNENLSYLLGFSYGDGCVEYDKFNEPVSLMLAVEHKRELLKNRLIEIFKYYNLPYSIRKGCGAVDKITINSKKFVMFLQDNNLLKEKSEAIKMPENIKKSPANIQASFFAGYFDADGCNSGKKSGYRFSSVKKSFLLDLQSLLLLNGVISCLHIYKRKNINWRTLYCLNITGAYSQSKFIDLIGYKSIKVNENKFVAKRDNIKTPFNCKVLKTNSNKYKFIQDNFTNLSLNAFNQLNECDKLNIKNVLFLDEIKFIEKENFSDTYDLVLEKEHLFYCEGFYVHNSGRRGALMITIDIQHPDVEKFITIKQNLKKVTGANISVKLSDEFMDAVKKNKNYTHKWPINSETPEVTKTIKARDLWDVIVKCAHNTAEPGLIFWDRHHRYSTSSIYPQFKNISTNPCLVGDTIIAVADGRNGVTIKQLADENKEFLVYAMKNGKQIITKATAFKTGNNQNVIKVSLVDGSNFICTPDHEIMIRSGKYIKAKDLKKGQFLMPLNDLYVEKKSETTSLNEIKKVKGFFNYEIFSIEDCGCQDVYDLNVPETSNFGIITSYKDDTKFIKLSGVFVHNCGEIPMGNDSCRLVAVNMFNCVKSPFSKDAEFDFNKWYEIVYEAQRINDDLVDLELESIEKILKKIDKDEEPEYIKFIERKTWEDLHKVGKKGRRTGLGFTALADTLAALGFKYDSNKALEITEEIMKMKCKAEFDSSIDMAIERGTFEGFDEKIENESEFVQMLKKELPDTYERMMKVGRRNVSLSTVAPTGSISLLAQVSSGIEPVFNLSYKRRKKINPNDKNVKVDHIDDLGDKWQEYDVLHPKLKMWKEITEKESIENNPWFNSTAEEIDWNKRIKMQSIVQKYVTHSISSTINLPSDVSIETVGEIYQKSWQAGLKGITVYRAGARNGVMFSEKDKKEVSLLEERNAPKRPKILESNVIRFVNDKEKWIGFIGLLNNRPYEIFTGKLENFPLPTSVENGQIKKSKIINGKGEKTSKYDFVFVDKNGEEVILENLNKSFNSEYWNYAKMISGILRHGMPLAYVVDLIDGLDLKDELLNTWKVGVCRMIKKYIKDGTEAKDRYCKECGDEKGLVYEEGCLKCKNCGFSKCG